MEETGCFRSQSGGVVGFVCSDGAAPASEGREGSGVVHPHMCVTWSHVCGKSSICVHIRPSVTEDYRKFGCLRRSRPKWGCVFL